MCKEFPASAMPVTEGSTVYVKNLPVDGEITRILLKKQVKPQDEVDTQPHLRHWWLMFHVKGQTWMQVDLIQLRYRIIWDAEYAEAEGIRFEEKAVPSGLTAHQVVAEVNKIAAAEKIYYNPVVPNPQYRRYGCHDFAILLAERLGTSL